MVFAEGINYNKNKSTRAYSLAKEKRRVKASAVLIVPVCYMAVEIERQRERLTRTERNGGGADWGCFWFTARPGHSDEPWAGRWDKNSALLMPRCCTSQCLVLTWADQWSQVSAGSDFCCHNHSCHHPSSSQWFPTRGNFASQGLSEMSGAYLSVTEGECYWYLVGRGEECCWVSCSA